MGPELAPALLVALPGAGASASAKSGRQAAEWNQDVRALSDGVYAAEQARQAPSGGLGCYWPGA